jgi:hypothetical protein
MYKKTGFIWLAILALSCMFLAGQAWAQCSEPPADADSDGCTDPLDLCPTDPADGCAPTVLPAADLSVAPGCATYIGPHPIPAYAGVLACCSSPSSGSAPKCAAGDTPDIECVVEYEFCSDGTAMKAWDGDPAADLPGHVVATGTWGYSGSDLIVTTTGIVMAQPMTTVETYEDAFTYNSGAKLDLYSSAKTSGSSVLGIYASQSYLAIDLVGVLDMDADITRATTVSAGCPPTWAEEEDQEITCVGAGCAAIATGHFDFDSIGAVAVPNGNVYQNGSKYFFQVTDKLVLDRQP